MRLSILIKLSIILILVFKILPIFCFGEELLYPLNNRVRQKKIHIIGKIKHKETLTIKYDNESFLIDKDSLIPVKTIDGKFYLFKAEIELKKRVNLINLKCRSFSDNLTVIYTDKQNIYYKTFFHMNDKNVYCKVCHKFNSVDECTTCHNSNSGKFVHGPVAASQCFICHDKNNYFVVKQPLSAQCLKCHKEFSDAMYEAKFSHAPVVAGDCTICHLPHQSNEKFFLKEKVANICSKCHEGKSSGYHITGKNIKVHLDIFCTKCHNPHYGENKSLFPDKIKIRKNLCGRCHN